MRPFDLFSTLNMDRWTDQQTYLPLEKQFYISVLFMFLSDNMLYRIWLGGNYTLYEGFSCFRFVAVSNQVFNYIGAGLVEWLQNWDHCNLSLSAAVRMANCPTFHACIFNI